MSTQQIVELIQPVLQAVVWPAAGAFLLWLYHDLKTKLPANKQAVLGQIVKDAVQMVEQTLSNFSPQDKRKAAEMAIIELAAFFGYHNLDLEAVNTILESFVWETKQAVSEPLATLDTIQTPAIVAPKPA